MAKANALSQGKAGRASGSSAGSQKKASKRSLADLAWLLPGPIYKRNQGRVARQVTFAALAVTVMMASWSFYGFLQGGMVPDFWSNLADGNPLVTVYAPAGAFLLSGCWISFRVVAGWRSWQKTRYGYTANPGGGVCSAHFLSVSCMAAEYTRKM